MPRGCRRGRCSRLLRSGLSDAEGVESGHGGLHPGHEEAGGRHSRDDDGKTSDHRRPTASTQVRRRNGARPSVDCQATQQFGLVFGHSGHPILVRVELRAISAGELKQLRDTGRCQRDGLWKHRTGKSPAAARRWGIFALRRLVAPRPYPLAAAWSAPTAPSTGFPRPATSRLRPPIVRHVLLLGTENREPGPHHGRGSGFMSAFRGLRSYRTKGAHAVDRS